MNKQDAIGYLEDLLATCDCLNFYCGRHDEAIKMAISALEQQLNGGWIPVSERLPEEKISPITHDYYEYECTFNSGRVVEVRFYKFGDGHWWHGNNCIDQYITAWRERPEPYKEVSE